MRRKPGVLEDPWLLEEPGACPALRWPCPGPAVAIENGGTFADRGFRGSLEAQLVIMAQRLSHRLVAIGFHPTQQRKLASHPQNT